MIYSLMLPCPPSANMLFPTGKNGKRFRSKRYELWLEEASQWLKQCAIPNKPLEGRLYVKYTYVFGDKRSRDVANYEKCVSDFLVKIGAIKDDSQIDMMSLNRSPEISKPASVTVEYGLIREVFGE